MTGGFSRGRIRRSMDPIAPVMDDRWIASNDPVFHGDAGETHKVRPPRHR